jgi:hypothetical protein
MHKQIRLQNKRVTSIYESDKKNLLQNKSLYLVVPLNIECQFDVMFWIKCIVNHRLTAQLYFRPTALPGILSSVTTEDRSVADSKTQVCDLTWSPT